MPRHRPRSTAVRLAGTGVTVSALPRQSEASFMAQVVAYAESRRWHAWHDRATNAPRRCPDCGSYRRLPRNDAGFPDLVLIRRPRLVVVECKRDGEYPSDAQRGWLDAFAACEIETYLWRPSDWADVVRILR